MGRLISKFCKDERGTLLLTEWVFLTTILMIAMVPCLISLRGHVGDSPLKEAAPTLTQPLRK
jgi:hypothetical protein